MPSITLHRKSRKQRALDTALAAVKARIAWAVGKRAARFAAPAVAVGTVAVVAKRRRSGSEPAAA